MSFYQGEARPKSHFEVESYFEHEFDHLDELELDEEEDLVKSSNVAAPLPEL